MATIARHLANGNVRNVGRSAAVRGARPLLSRRRAARTFSATTAAVSWPSVAIIGVGQLGAAVASNLLRHSVPLTLYDLHGDANVPPALRDARALDGAVWADTARAAAADADVVMTALPRPEHVTAAFHGDDGILAGLREGATWIEHSTTDFENTARVREQVEARGGHAVEAPLTGGMQLLQAGKMVALVGADPAVFEGRIADLVALSAPRIIRCGEFGHATIIKIFSNILCALHDVAVGETLCTAKKAGLDLRLVFDAMRASSGNSFCWETEVPRMLVGDYYPDFTAEMMHKDVSLGLDLGEKYGVPMPASEFVAARYEEAMARWGRDSGSAVPCRLVEEASGCRLADVAGADANDPQARYPGNEVNRASHGGAFKDWSYTSEFCDGSYAILHTGYDDNPYTRAPFTAHAGDGHVPAAAAAELDALRARVAELEAQLAT